MLDLLIYAVKETEVTSEPKFLTTEVMIVDGIKIAEMVPYKEDSDWLDLEGKFTRCPSH